MKRDKKGLLIVLIMVSVMFMLSSAFFVYAAPQIPDVKPDINIQVSPEINIQVPPEINYNSSFDYKLYHDHSRYKSVLRIRMNSVYSVLSNYMDDSATLPIPGLIETCTLHNGNNSLSADYIPQGLCQAGKYWLITAYDAKKENNSAIYVIDKTESRLVSTLTVPNTYHLGGIAFDGENIWLTGDTSDRYKGEPFVQYITFTDFNNMISEPLHEITNNEISEYVYIKNKPSFLECDNGTLWVGTYMGRKDTAESYMNGYRITEEEGRKKLNTTVYSLISGLDSSAQGADIEGNFLYVSSSFKGSAVGVKSSFITKYDITPIRKGSKILNIEKRESSRIEVPKMNEEIAVENGRIYINFESGAQIWKNPVMRTDRLLAVKKTLWGEMKP